MAENGGDVWKLEQNGFQSRQEMEYSSQVLLAKEFLITLLGGPKDVEGKVPVISASCAGCRNFSICDRERASAKIFPSPSM